MEKKKSRKIGEGEVYLGEDNIIYTVPIGDMDEKTAIAFRDTILEYMNMVEGKAKGIVDLNNGGKQTLGARKAFKELNDNEKVGKLAFIGLHQVARVLASFAMGISQNKNLRFFRTKEEALAWLKE